MDLTQLLAFTMQNNASDLHLSSGSPPIIRVNGQMKRVKGESLGSDDIRAMLYSVMTEEQRAEYEKNMELDFAIALGEKARFRVNGFTTRLGAAAVFRTIPTDIPTMEELDLPPVMRRFAELEKGIILVTGPTGSGKSTTLHAFLQQVATPDLNIITVEDPVEYKADNINQIQTNAKAGLTFASGLRSILRQDPDVIMVGEIRDGETAEIAIQAALTGHLVFSTLHTNNSTASITRLVDMGVQQFLIGSSLLGVLAQRLVRKLCNECKVEDKITEEYAEEFGLPSGAVIYEEKGCKACNYTGYAGRQAIGEFFEMNDDFRSILKENVSDHVLRELAVKQGMVPLSRQLKNLLLEGKTSMHEIIRVGVKDA